MPAAEIPITIEQGSVYNPVYNWKDDDGNPIDITGWTGKMQIRESKDKNSTLVFTCSTTNGNFTINGASGEFRPKILASETEDFDFGWAYYDIELTPPSGSANTKRVAQGPVELDKQVTD